MATKKATTKATKVAEVKVEAPVVETPVVEAPVVEVKEEVKKAPAKKAAAKKEVAKKEAAPAEKKAPAKKAAAKAETVISVQFGGNEVVIATVEEKVKAQVVAEGLKASAIKSLNIYVKPEENAAYYVVNGDVTGRVDLF